jgi:integrase
VGHLSNIQRRGNRLYYRQKIPVDISSRFRRREICWSLQTGDYKKAIARMHGLRLKLSQLFDVVRGDAVLSRAETEDILKDILAVELQTWEENRRGAALTREQLVDEKTRYASSLSSLREALGRSDFSDIVDDAVFLLDQRDVFLDQSSDGFRAFCNGMLRTLAEAHAIILARLEGDYAVGAKDPLLDGVTKQLKGLRWENVFEYVEYNEAVKEGEEEKAAEILQAAIDKYPTLRGQPTDEVKTIDKGAVGVDKLLKDFLNERQDLKPKTIGDYEAAVRVLKEFKGGDIDVNSVKPSDVVDLKALLLQCPSNYSKRFPGLIIVEAVKKNEDADYPTLEAKSINKYLSNLTSLFGWGKRNHLCKINPAAGIKVDQRRKSPRDQRSPFNEAELQLLFATPLFTGCKSRSRVHQAGKHKISDHRFWVPQIALWTGMRATEIGQLHVDDIVEEKGVWCINVTSRGDDDKSLKTPSSERSVPIHQQLKQAGLLKYIEKIRQDGSQRLFPLMTKGKDGYYSSPWSKWFARFLKETGLKRPDLVFHSFRHTFEDALREAGVDDSIQKRLMGHSDQSITAGYGRGHSIERLNVAIQSISYPTINNI